MNANSINAQAAQTPATGLRGTLQRHPIASYFVIMFAGLWLGYLPLLLSSEGFGILSITFPFPPQLFNIPASLFGPLVAGLVMSWAVGGKQGIREFRQRLFRFRFGVQWYVLPLVVVPVLGVLSVAVMLGLTPVSQFISQVGVAVVPYVLGTVIFGLLINLWEESGQIGFALPVLQRRHGAVLASLIIAPMWALMHLPALFVPDLGIGISGPLTLQNLAISMGVLIVYAIPIRIIATWLFNNAGQSVVVVAFFHAAMNSAQSQFQALLPDYNTFYLLGAFVVVGFILIAVTRGKLGYKAEPEPTSYQVGTVQQAAPLVQA